MILFKVQTYLESRKNTENAELDWPTYAQTIAEPINIIAVDATWGQARSMAASVPDSIIRVHLANPPKFSLSEMRNQGTSGRITTAEGTNFKINLKYSYTNKFHHSILVPLSNLLKENILCIY